jgi:hypothetical protein
MIDKSAISATSEVYILLCGFCFLFGLFWSPLLPEWGKKRKELAEKYRNLLSEVNIAACHDGVVTVTDLVLRAKISPSEATEFLEKLTKELDIPPQVDDSGAIYYVFPRGSEIASQKRLTASNKRY